MWVLDLEVERVVPGLSEVWGWRLLCWGLVLSWVWRGVRLVAVGKVVENVVSVRWFRGRSRLGSRAVLRVPRPLVFFAFGRAMVEAGEGERVRVRRVVGFFSECGGGAVCVVVSVFVFGELCVVLVVGLAESKRVLARSGRGEVPVAGLRGAARVVRAATGLFEAADGGAALAARGARELLAAPTAGVHAEPLLAAHVHVRRDL